MTEHTPPTFDREKFLNALRRSLAASGVASLLNEEREAVLAGLAKRLLEENRRYNLTAIREEEKAALLHFTDSLTIASLLPENASVIDVGAGGGFPSLPLAVCRPDLRITALDATEKKVFYLNESARLFGISNLRALAGRAEALASDAAHREKYDVATARAVSALPVLTELCLPFVRTGGIFLAMKGEAAEAEIAAAGDAPILLGAAPFRKIPLSLSDGQESFLRYAVVTEKRTATPRAYPRLYTKIVKSPLPKGRT